ncbi:unnamed protein product, partial [Closterium sp. NIES-54]
ILRPSSVPHRVALPSPPASSLLDVPEPESDLARAASPTVTRLLATVVTDPSFESTASFALVTKLVDYVASLASRKWHNTLRTTLATLGFAPSIADPSLFLRTDPTLPPFYILVYVDDLVFATTDTEALTLFSLPHRTPLPTGHSLSAPPLDESVEPSGPYPELVGCLMKEHWTAAQRVPHYLCSTSGMGLVLRGRGSLVFTGHSDASSTDDQVTQRSSQGNSFSLGSGSVSWRSTRSSSVLGSSCEAEIYAGAMAAQELRWLTYLLIDLGERPCLPPVLYVDNKAMIAL